MSDSDSEERKSNYSNHKKGSLGSSFRQAANNIIGEGIIPSANQNSNYKTILGKRPINSYNNDNLNSSQKRKSSSVQKNPLMNSQRRNDDNQSVDSIIMADKIKVKDSKIKQDILTKQAIDDVKDHIELFKMDINKYIAQLREQQEKIELGDVKEDIKILEENLDRDLKDARSQSDKELTIIKEQFFQFKEKVFELISKVAKENEGKISQLFDEIKKYEDIVSQQFLVIQDKQEEYINLLKLILETTKDPNTKVIVEQFLINDQEIFENNKERYEKEYNEKQEKIRKKKEEKERKQVKQLLDDEIQKLETEAKHREETEIQKKQYELMKEYEERQKLQEEREIERMKKLEEIEKYLREQKSDEEEIPMLPPNYYYPRIRPRYQEDYYYDDESYDRRRRKKKRKKKKETETEEEEEEEEEKPKKKKKKKKKEEKEEKSKKSEKIIVIGNQQPQQPQYPYPFPYMYPQNPNQPQNITVNIPNQPQVQVQEKEKLSENLVSKKEKKKNDNTENAKEEVKEDVKITNLREFADDYIKGENALLNYMQKGMKEGILNLIKSLPIDITDDKFTGEKENDRALKEKLSLLTYQVKEFLNELLSIFNKISMNEDIKKYMRLVLKDNSFIPYKYFSLFELSRMNLHNGYVLHIDEQGKKMIIAFHVILKILLKHYLLDNKFIKDEGILDERSKSNFKIVASIIYHEIIELFKEKCSLTNNITDLPKFLENQSNNDPNLRNFIAQLDNRILSGFPDNDINQVSYIAEKLYPKEKLALYYQNNQEKAEIKQNVLEFTDKFLQMIQS